METISISDLTPCERLGRDMYDPQTGVRLLEESDSLTIEMVHLLMESHLDRIVLLDFDDDAGTIFHNSQYKELSHSAVKPDTILEYDIFMPDGSLLLTKGTRLTGGVVAQLERRRYRGLKVRKPADPARAARVNKLLKKLSKLAQRKKMPRTSFAPAELISDPQRLNPRGLNRMIDEMQDVGQLVAHPDKLNPLLMYMNIIDSSVPRQQQTKNYYQELYANLVQQTGLLFSAARRNEQLSGHFLISMTDQVLHALVTDRELLFSVISAETPDKDYLAQHAVNVAIISVNIAATAGFSPKQITEIGFGALLSDIGMLGVPEEIRFKQQALSSNEQREVMKHVNYGVDYLRKFEHLPRTAALIAYQYHERLDGSGYPQCKRASSIHDYAKIVAIADIYHALISERPYRKKTFLPYKAVEELLSMVSRHQLAGPFVKAMLSTVSLFPIGSWVRLNTGELAQVLAADASEYTRPSIAVLFDAQGQPCTPKRIKLTEAQDTTIISPARVEFTDRLAGF